MFKNEVNNLRQCIKRAQKNGKEDRVRKLEQELEAILARRKAFKQAQKSYSSSSGSSDGTGVVRSTLSVHRQQFAAAVERSLARSSRSSTEISNTVQAASANSHTREIEVKTGDGTTTTTRDIHTTTNSKSATQSVKEEFEQKHVDMVRMYKTATLETIHSSSDFRFHTIALHWLEQLPHMYIVADKSEARSLLREFVGRIVGLPHSDVQKQVMMWVDAEEQQRVGSYENVMPSKKVLANVVGDYVDHCGLRIGSNDYMALYDTLMLPGTSAMIWAEMTMPQIADVLQHGHIDRISVFSDFAQKERGLMGGIGYLLTTWLLHSKQKKIDEDYAPGSAALVKTTTAMKETTTTPMTTSDHDDTMVTFADGTQKRFRDISSKVKADIRRGVGVDGGYISRNVDRTSGDVDQRVVRAHGVQQTMLNNKEIEKRKKMSTIYAQLYNCFTGYVMDDDYAVYNVDVSFWTTSFKQVKFVSVPVVPATAGIIVMYDRLAAASYATQELNQARLKAINEAQFDRDVLRCANGYRGHSNDSLAGHMGLYNMCGYTHDELRANLPGRVGFKRALHAKKLQDQQDKMYKKLMSGGFG